MLRKAVAKLVKVDDRDIFVAACEVWFCVAGESASIKMETVSPKEFLDEMWWRRQMNLNSSYAMDDVELW